MMDSGFRTPLLDTFKQGTVDLEFRMLAARGDLAPRAAEHATLLVLLVSDPSEEVSAAAEATLAAVPRATLTALLNRSDVPAEIRAFFQSRGVEADGGAPLAADVSLLVNDAAASAGASDDGSTLQKLSAMNVAQRLQRAMKGNREERAILIRDPNKIVAAAVLSSPKLTETEVESIAKMANVSEEVLRIIANTRAWVKNYQVALALAKNPKTPAALSMNLLSRLTERDLKMISTDKNVPDVLRLTARKKLVMDK